MDKEKSPSIFLFVYLFRQIFLKQYCIISGMKRYIDMLFALLFVSEQKQIVFMAGQACGFADKLLRNEV